MAQANRSSVWHLIATTARADLSTVMAGPQQSAPAQTLSEFRPSTSLQNKKLAGQEIGRSRKKDVDARRKPRPLRVIRGGFGQEGYLLALPRAAHMMTFDRYHRPLFRAQRACKRDFGGRGNGATVVGRHMLLAGCPCPNRASLPTTPQCCAEMHAHLLLL
jgi:hypothetical protein